MRILGLSGSLRSGSYNRLLLEAAARELPRGADFELFEGLDRLPYYNEDANVVPAHPAVRRLRDAIARADALLISTPEYNASLPGALKNALDWASRPVPDNCLRGKPVAVLGASTSLFGPVWALAELRKVLVAIGALVIDRQLPVPRAHEAFDATGLLLDGNQRRLLAELVSMVLAEWRQAAVWAA